MVASQRKAWQPLARSVDSYEADQITLRPVACWARRNCSIASSASGFAPGGSRGENLDLGELAVWWVTWHVEPGGCVLV